MLRLKALGSRRCVASVKDDARRPTEASATSTRGMRAIFSGASLGRNDSDRRGAANPAFCHAVAAVAATQR